MDIRGVEITNQLRSAIRAKLLELGVRHDDELPDYILVMVVNKKSRSQMNEDLNLFLEDNTETFVDWMHDQVLKKLQKVTVAKKKSNKDALSTANVKQEEGKKSPKIEDEETTKSNTPTRELTKDDRDKEFDELVGDLAMLNEDDGKSDLKESQATEEGSPKTNTVVSDGESSIESSPKNPERKSIDSNVSIPETTGSERQTTPEIISEKINDTPSLKRISTDNSSDETAQSAKRSKICNDSDSEDDSRIKSSVTKSKICSVVSVKTRLGTTSPSKKQESEAKKVDARSPSNKNEISSQKTSSTQSKSTDRRKPRTEDSRNELQNDDGHPVHNSSSEKANRIEEPVDKERLSAKSSTIKSRLGMNSSKKEVSPLKSTNSTKVSKPRVSNVKSRLGIRSKQSTSRLDKISQKNFQEEDDAETEINTSLKSHIIAVPKPRPQKRKQTSSESDKSQNLIVEETEDDSDDECKILSKIIVTPRPLKPLKPIQKRATQSLLLKAVAEANQSVVMRKKIDPCLKEQTKSDNKIKITRDPWKGKVLSVSLNGKNRNVMDQIQVKLTNPDKSKKPRTKTTKKSQVVSDEHMDVVKSLFKRSDNKQKFLVTLNGYNNNVHKEKNSDDEERLDVELIDIEEDDLSPVNNQYDAYDDEVQVIEIDEDNNDQPLSQDQDMPEDTEEPCTNTYTAAETEAHRYIEVIDTYSSRYEDMHLSAYANPHLIRYAVNYPEPQRTETYTAPQPDRYAAPQPDRYTAPQSDRYTAPQTDRYAAPQSDRYAASQADRYTAPQTDRYTAQQPDRYTTQDTDRYATTQSERYTTTQSDRYTATQPDRYAATQPDRYTATQPDRYTATQPDRYTATQPDRYTATQPDRYTAQHSDRYADTYTNKHQDNYTDPHANRYVEKRTDNYAVNYVDPNANKYTEKRSESYTEPRTTRFADRYIDDYMKPYDETKSNRKDMEARKHLKVQESFSKSRRKLSPIVYTRSRSNSSEKRPRLASQITSVLRINKRRPLISSIITTVADKSSEKCRYWPNCTLGIKCAYNHPEVLCSSFPACKFGEKCAYKHPKCKYGSACTKLGCKFSHPPVKCKYHPYCMKPGCQFSHPKTTTTSPINQPLTPDMNTVRAKFTWKKNV